MTPRRAAQWCRRAVLAAWVASLATPAAAQTPSPDRAWEITGGATWTRGFALGALTGNETQPNGNPFPLFTAQTRLDSERGFGATVSRRVGGPFSLEAFGLIDHLTYRTSVTADFEQAALIDATNVAMAYSVGGAVVVTLARRARVQPFVRVGVGWRRELSEDRTLSADGRFALVGGGVKYWFGGAAGGGRIGVRVEAGAIGRSGGLLIGDRTRFAPGFNAGGSFRF